MKNSLGKHTISIFIFFSISLLYGNGFTTNASLDKERVFVKEAVVLTFDIKQTDYAKVMFFDFTLTESEAYEFHRLDVKEEDSYQNAQIHYTYLLYPLKSGEIEIGFELIQKVTTKEDVAYSFSGDRDNVKGITTTDTPIALAPLKLAVKPLPEGTQLIGDFTLTHELKTHQANAYEPIPFTVEIKGRGYPPILENSFLSTKEYTLFKETPEVKTIRSAKHTDNTVTYPMAISAEQSFTFDEINIRAFNPKTQTSYILTVPKEEFKITPVAHATLLDKVDSPAPIKATDWSWIGTLLGYMAVFLSGFFTAKSVQWYKKEKIKEDPLIQQINQTSDPKALLTLLIAEDSKKFAPAIEKLEAHIYGKKPLNLKAIKKELNA
ncbi:BatD family protein [Sulfurovum mangrovi]|uniref:BatD family protein n=1 Tax=Sulfurovum mangrovi TaxID=2893889 RepID=UPI001E59D6DC|nr:BatD family protein [Sulfurovum mangrovi]UFH58151.1 BatD family protein [Sulfurovum mangrovi]